LAAGAALLAAVWAAGPTQAESPPASLPPVAGQVVEHKTDADAKPGDAKPAGDAMPAGDAPADGILQTGCSTCGNGLLAPPSGGGGCAGCGGCGSGDCASGCYPGRTPCDCCCCGNTCVGRFFCGLYQCICCPDPCYDPPHWLAVADSAFFVPAARPITQTRLRWDSMFDIQHIDRAEYIWAKEGLSPVQLGPTNCVTNVTGKGPMCVAQSVDIEQLSLYTEAAAGPFGAFVEIPYEEVEPEAASINAALMPSGMGCCQHSGFADMNAGFKSLLLDCELIQFTFQFTTYIPIGQTGKGLGTGHTSLEPAFLMAIKLGPCTYLQLETAYWIPIHGDQVYATEIFHSHASINHILWHPCHDFQIIGTAEVNEWTMDGGAYTATDILIGGAPVSVSASDTIVSAGPGIRAVLCDKIDLGVGSAFSLTGQRWAREDIRAELRLRF
jgi:hypothetical protein